MVFVCIVSMETHHQLPSCMEWVIRFHHLEALESVFIVKVVRTAPSGWSNYYMLSIHLSYTVGEIPLFLEIIGNRLPFYLCPRYLFNDYKKSKILEKAITIMESASN